MINVHYKSIIRADDQAHSDFKTKINNNHAYSLTTKRQDFFLLWTVIENKILLNFKTAISSVSSLVANLIVSTKQ